MERLRNSKKGFTLVELIVVIAILGILAIIVVPKLGGYKTSAWAAADKASAKVIENAISLAIADGSLEGDGTVTIANNTIGVSGFTKGTAATITNLLANSLSFSATNSNLSFPVVGGTVTNPLADGGGSSNPPVAPVLTGINISTAGTNVQTPTITLPVLANMPAGVTGIGWTENSNYLSISNGVLTATRDFTNQTATFRLTATWSGGTVTRDFNVTIPAGTGWPTTYPALTIN